LVRRKKSFIPLLRRREVHFFQDLDLMFIGGNQPFLLQCGTHPFIDAMHFRPGLRDHDQRLTVFRQPQVFIRQPFLLVIQPARLHRTQLVQTVKRFGEPTRGGFFHSATILADELFLGSVPAMLRVLAANGFQFSRTQVGVTLQRQQRIRRLDRPVLPGVAGENDPAFSGAHDSNEFKHLPRADLPGLIHHDHAAFWHGLTIQKIGNRGRMRQPVLS
jgi:hypothetical protein